MSTLKNNIQKRINAAAVPKLREGKKVNGDFVLRPKLMNSPVSLG